MCPVTQGLPAGAAHRCAPDPAARERTPLRGRGPGGAPNRTPRCPAARFGVPLGEDGKKDGHAPGDRTSWASGAVPHPVYGLITAPVHRALR